jgi:hypothetical protein
VESEPQPAALHSVESVYVEHSKGLPVQPPMPFNVHPRASQSVVRMASHGVGVPEHPSEP